MVMPLINVNDIVLINKFYTEKHFFASKMRNTHILGYQISGEYHHTIADRKAIAKNDTVILINKNTDYRVETKEPGISIAFHFTAQDDSLVPDCFIDCAQIQNLKRFFFLHMILG